MTQREKRFWKLASNPKETSFSEINTILGDFGFRIIRKRGSHFYFMNNSGEKIIIVNHNNRVKKVYVKKLLDLITKTFNESKEL